MSQSPGANPSSLKERLSMKHLSLVIGAALSLYSVSLFAHGEDKAGPHGGYVRMPGAFHTEVVKEGKDKLRIYLLDLAWKNPSVKDSSVEAMIKDKKTTNILSCEKETDSYVCSSKKGTLKLKGQLEILAMREGQVGIAAIYPLPFKFEQ